MSLLVYAWPGNEALGAALVSEFAGEHAEISVRRFPDDETYVRLLTSPADRDVVFACGLQRPDEKSIGLYFAATAARELGARSIGLVSPYLAYMRQDARFNAGEAVTSIVFARWLSQFVDWLVTMDPHLHRHHALDEVYAIPTAIASSTAAISRWITAEVDQPLIMGPDAESLQWAKSVADLAHCPYLVLDKQRRGDRDVEVSVPALGEWHQRTPVLVDDIISTARTMIAAALQLRALSSRPPVCVGVHALFSDDAQTALNDAGVARVATCNTVMHSTNAIDVLPDIARVARSLFLSVRRSG